MKFIVIVIVIVIVNILDDNILAQSCAKSCDEHEPAKNMYLHNVFYTIRIIINVISYYFFERRYIYIFTNDCKILT